ncbi:MAG: PorT family protein [Crocinitomicaceae bacterium]|nr:PorT family protein [Crocinitomicaceae bacterium]
MKRTLLVLLFFPLLSIAQDEDIKKESPFSHYKWEIGINGGVNITNVSGMADSTNVLRRIGNLYGVTVTYHLNKYIAIKTDIDFENKGWTVNDVSVMSPNGTESIQNVNQHLDYFDIPAFLHIGFGNRFKFDFNFGPYIAFLTKNRAFYEDPNGVEIPVTEDLFQNFSATDFGLTYGAGIDLALGKRWSFGFDFLYEHGLKKINTEGLKNTSLDFDFGINFLFGEKKKK